MASCARRAIGQRADDRSIGVDGVDWPLALWLAELHRVVPLLHVALNAFSQVPPSVRDQLTSAVEENARRNLLMTSRLVELLAALRSAGIDAMPLKGPVLAAIAYGNVSLRQFADLDILVRHEDVPRAVATLAAAGYHGRFPDSPSRRDMLLECRNQLSLRSGERLQVELHWNVVPAMFPVRIDLPGLWRRSSPVRLFGEHIAHPSVDDLVVLLAIHGAKHQWRRLLWLVDVAALVRSTRPDWDRVLDLAEQARAGRILRVALLLILDVLSSGDDANLPPPVRRWAHADAHAASIARRLRHNYPVDRGDPLKPFEDLWNQSQSMERWVDKWRFGTRAVFTPTSAEWNLVELPAPLTFLYSVVRAGRLTMKYGGRAVRQAATSIRD